MPNPVYSGDHVLVMLVFLLRPNGLDRETIDERYDALNHSRLLSERMDEILQVLSTAGLAEQRSGLWYPTDCALEKFSNRPNDPTDWGPDFLFLCDKFSVPRPF
jgi:hypothetical protein